MVDASATRIRHVACGESDLFATAVFEKNVTLWSLSDRSRLAEFTTGLDYGGRRLAVVDDRPTAVVAGAYNVHGISGYDRAGARLWHRRDLKAVQHVTAIAWPSLRQAVAVGLAHTSLHFLDLADGRTIDKLRGVRHIYAGRDGWLLGVVGKKEVRAYDWTGLRVLWKAPLRTFTVLDAALSESAVLYSEVGGVLRCFARDGAHLWDAPPGRDGHALRVAWNDAAHCWLFVTWPYRKGGDKTLVALDADGRELFAFNLGTAEFGFFGDGAHLVMGDGRVLQTQTGESAWKFGHE